MAKVQQTWETVHGNPKDNSPIKSRLSEDEKYALACLIGDVADAAIPYSPPIMETVAMHDGATREVLASRIAEGLAVLEAIPRLSLRLSKRRCRTRAIPAVEALLEILREGAGVDRRTTEIAEDARHWTRAISDHRDPERARGIDIAYAMGQVQTAKEALREAEADLVMTKRLVERQQQGTV
jgi:hypothetical protein